jgi:hypothetical protein
MLDWLRRRRAPEHPAPPAIRDVLFGDTPADRWPPADGQAMAEPWASFVAAREHLAAGRRGEAIAVYRRIAGTAGLEPRHHLQAWHALRGLGVTPDASLAKQVLGVVVEVPMNGGLDLLAAYADRSARYFNYSGAGVVWEHPDDRLDGVIDVLLAAGRTVAGKIGPWDGERPGPPPPGQIRLNLLTPSGLHFGQAPFDALAADPLGGPAVMAATSLMKQLTEIEREGRSARQ